MLTGLYPPEHGIRLNGKNSLHPSIPLVTEQLRDAGYATGAFVASFVLGRKFGLDRGFDVYDDSLKGAEKTLLDIHQYRNGKLVTDAALKWLVIAGRQETLLLLGPPLRPPHPLPSPPRSFWGRSTWSVPTTPRSASLISRLDGFCPFLLREG